MRISASFDLLLCLGMAFMLAVPATAWGMHNLSHGLSAVAVDHHHEHARPPGIEPRQGDRDPLRDKQDGGHDHLLSLSIPVGALFGETPLLKPALMSVSVHPTEVRRLALWPAEPPPSDPPRNF